MKKFAVAVELTSHEHSEGGCAGCGVGVVSPSLEGQPGSATSTRLPGDGGQKEAVRLGTVRSAGMLCMSWYEGYWVVQRGLGGQGWGGGHGLDHAVDDSQKKK